MWGAGKGERRWAGLARRAGRVKIAFAMPPLLGLIIASAGLGALVGLIRQWSDQVAKPANAVDFGGVRTHTLWAILGCLGAVASRDYAPFSLPIVLIAVAAHLIFWRRQERADGATPGSTSFAASLLTLFIGALVAWDQTQSAIVITALTMVLLGLKQPLHAWTRAFTEADIRATLQFVAVTGVVLPLVPNRNFGPLEAFNPYTTWMFVVLISGLGFAGYVAMRLLGARAGLLVTSLLGGLASSTAATLAFSRRSRQEPALSAHYAFAVVIACTVMLARIALVIGILNRQLALALLLPFACMTLPAVGYGGWLWRTRQSEFRKVEAPNVGNPLGLPTAIKFALLYALISFLVKAATHAGWQTGLLPLSFASGLTDMDAISLTLANNLKTGAIPLPLATQAVIVAAVANSVLKAALAVGFGSPALRRHVAVVLGLTAVAGVIAIFIV
jgi:uncharacterized membrane protein (DUF4010 family)